MANVLIVDDSPTMIEVLKVHLMGEGHVFCCAPNAEAALEALSRTPPDVIISDLAMPGVSGLDLCKRIRSMRALRHCPFVLVTSKYDESTRKEAFNAGADAFLKKPVDPRHLTDVMKQLLNR